MPATTVEFDPFSPEYFADPTAVFDRIREEAPVYFNEKYGFYALSRFDDVMQAHRDWKTYSSAHGVDLSTLSKDPEMIKLLGMIIMMDPPEHDRYRALVSRVFTPRAVSRLEPMIREVISSFLDELMDRDEFDAVEDFAAPFPVEIISRMLGVPEGERQQIRHWLDLSLHREPGEMDPTPEGAHALLELVAYFLELTAEKRKNPADDMLSRLTEAEVEREDGTKTQLTDKEIAGFASLLGGAGAETVIKFVGNAVVLLDAHPDQRQLLVDDPSKLSAAVEEILRIDPPSQYQGRFSKAERTFDGGTIPAGVPVLLLTGAATRDPRAFDRPTEMIIDRPPNVTLSLGHGIHSCLGAALARMEGKVAIEEMISRWDRLAVHTDELKRVAMSNVAGYSSVPVTATRRS